jgi:hypothetical protein
MFDPALEGRILRGEYLGLYKKYTCGSSPLAAACKHSGMHKYL